MQHLAVIMDGNRRWAKKNNLAAVEGHTKGRDAARLVTEFCIKNDIKYLSLYTFSFENFRRSTKEKEHIFTLLLRTIEKQLDEFIKEGIRIRFIGDRSQFPADLAPAISYAEEQTKELSRLQLNILFCYGGKQEFIHAVRTLATKVKEGEIDVEDIDEVMLQDTLWTSGIPDPDLILRTGGVSRLSNFFPLQSVYSELAFLDCYWPEITEEHLQKCIDSFKTTKRNFGH